MEARPSGVCRAEIKRLQEEPVSAEELAKAKMACVAEHDVALQGSGARAQAAALDELYGLGSDEIFKYAAAINKVTPQQVQSEAAKLLDLTHCVVVITRPEPGK